MSTHNIGFYEDLTKIIFQLSSNMHLISSSASSYSHSPLTFIRCTILDQLAVSTEEGPLVGWLIDS